MRHGDADAAGFVQVMEGHVTDREVARRLDAESDPMLAEGRPDLLESITAYFEDGTFTDVAYFTSEADARAGEQNQIPEQYADSFAQWQATMKIDRFLDITPIERANDALEIVLERIDGALFERCACRGLQRSILSILVHPSAGAFDGVLVHVQKLLHEHYQLHLAPLVHTVAGAVLRRMQKAELAFPVAKHMRLEIGEIAHVADRKELTDWYGGHDFSLHSSRSGRGSRFIRSTIASRGA